MGSKIRAIIVLCIFGALLSLCGCGEGNPFEGKWEATYVDFAPNKSNVSMDPLISGMGNYYGVLSEMAGLEVKNGRLVCYRRDNVEYRDFRNVEFDGDRLTFEFGDRLFGSEPFWYSAEVKLSSDGKSLTIVDPKWQYRMAQVSWFRMHKLLVGQCAFFFVIFVIAAIFIIRGRRLRKEYNALKDWENDSTAAEEVTFYGDSSGNVYDDEN